MLEFRFIFGNNGYEISKDMRKSIFADELGYTCVRDKYEDKSYHFVGYEKTQQISVGRLTPLGERAFKISYIGIKKDYRRQYVGDLIVRALADKAVALGGTSLFAEVPADVQKFFEFEDFEIYGDKFTKDSKEHVMMKKDLLKTHKCRGCSK